MMAELAETAETKQQIERDYRNKNDAFLSLSAEFLSLKVSLKVRVRFVCQNSDNSCANATGNSAYLRQG